MRFFTDEMVFNEEMKKVIEILKAKGYVLESDHVYAYSMQYGNAFKEVCDWLFNNGYEGNLNNLGYFEGVAVYCIYDTDRITYDEMINKLKIEASTQSII